MTKSKIINRAKKTLSTEIREIKNLSKILNDNFYKAVILLSKIKGRVIITGIGAPFSKSFVLSLNALQKSIMFKPLWPKAGPTGGEGFAEPAAICNLINPNTSLAIYTFSTCE